jgi:hypothetical protein
MRTTADTIKGLNVTGNNIGTATLGLQSDTTQGSAGVNASFFAQSYQLADGNTVISYRGTDALGGDAANGFGLAVGVPYGPQATMAIDFYKAVAGSNLTPAKWRSSPRTVHWAEDWPASSRRWGRRFDYWLLLGPAPGGRNR